MYKEISVSVRVLISVNKWWCPTSQNIGIFKLEVADSMFFFLAKGSGLSKHLVWF